MSKIIALDYGEARIGVAISDESQTYSFIRPAIITRDQREQLAQLVALATAEKAAEILIGLPLNLAGEPTAQTAVVKSFGVAAQAATGLPVMYRDERLTSQDAQRAIGHDRTGKLDSIVAQRLLEDHLTQIKS